MKFSLKINSTHVCWAQLVRHFLRHLDFVQKCQKWQICVIYEILERSCLSHVSCWPCGILVSCIRAGRFNNQYCFHWIRWKCLGKTRLCFWPAAKCGILQVWKLSEETQIKEHVLSDTSLHSHRIQGKQELRPSSRSILPVERYWRGSRGD